MTRSSRKGCPRPDPSSASSLQPTSSQAPAGHWLWPASLNPALLDLEAGGSPDSGTCCPLAVTLQTCNAPHVTCVQKLKGPQELSVTALAMSHLFVNGYLPLKTGPSGNLCFSPHPKLFNNVCCEDWEYKPGETGYFHVFIYQNLHKPDLIHQHKTHNQGTHTRPWRRLSSNLKDRKE